MKPGWIRWLLVLAIFLPYGLARAQESQPEGPVYIVQPGDTLWDIAARFGVDANELSQVNHLSDPGNIKVGDQLVIPGLEGITGRLDTRPVLLGEDLHSLSRTYGVPEEILVKLNHLTSPDELYAGADLVLPVRENQSLLGRRATLDEGQSLLELAVLQGVSTWSLARMNGFDGTWDALPGDVLHLPGASDGEPGALPPSIQQLSLTPDRLVQGKTFVIRLKSSQDLSLNGSFMGHELHFYLEEPGTYVALQGVHAMAEPGVYPIQLQGTGPGGALFAFSQMLAVEDGGYASDPMLYVDPATIDAQVTRPEDAEWTALAAPATPEKHWEGAFQTPVDAQFAECWPSSYGNRRAYNGGDYNYFHTGQDFCGAVGNAIYAPASGVVVFAGPLTVRGNATMIDHGWGVYTGYMHQSEIKVKVGDHVEAGQLIGLVGNSGRVTGPHLHFEVWVGGVQVDPLDWLQNVYP